MILPNHNKLYKLFFDFCASLIIKSDFKSIIIDVIGNENIQDKSLLVIANHFSWWDGILHYHLSNIFFKKKFHVLMLEDQLKKRMFLTKLGVFGVKKGTRDTIKFMNLAKQLLRHNDNMLLIFPQGKIESHHKQEFSFESGASKLIEKNPGVQVIFSVILIDYFSERKPVAKFYIKYLKENTIDSIEADYNVFYKECLQKQFQLAT